MQSIKRVAVAVIGLALAAGPVAFGQSATAGAASAKLPEFEVVSIKPTDPNAMHMIGVQLTKDQLTINATMLKGLICVAYDIPNWELSGGDPWMDTEFGNLKDHFDLVAKLPQDLAPYDVRHSDFEIKDEHILQMMQAMLADRFHLKVHRETKTGTVSILERSGKPLHLAPSKIEGAEASEEGSIGAAGGTGWGLDNTSMPQLARFLSNRVLHHPVIDKTGLDGSYDFRSATILANNEDVYDMTTFLPAVKEMGLKLTVAKGPVEMFVIDHAERPPAN